MANISRNTFDKLKHYVNVRMQQGVPLVDADWNEKDDIRKDQLETFLKLFIGSGVPEGNDGFAILPAPGQDNDVIIKGGSPGQPGICLVEGWDVRIENDILYSAQPLTALPLAAAMGVDPIPELTTPEELERTDILYLDVWEREVNGVEDPDIVNPDINIETCVRTKREWVVRVAEGQSQPPAAPAGHIFYPLAKLTRFAPEAEIQNHNITDLRRTRLTLGSAGFTDVVTVSGGNVGIGKTPAAEKLEVDGRIKDQTGYVMPAGGIIMWSGAADAVPQGWVLCDGNNDTPDLRDRFIVGAGNTYAVADTGGEDAVTLTVEQMPVHDHGASQDPHNHVNGEYDKLLKVTGLNTASGTAVDNIGPTQPDLIDVGELQEAAPPIVVGESGGGEAHENRPPYYALCFIMKL